MATLFGKTSQYEAIGNRLDIELAEVESRFTAELVSELPFVNDLVRHLEQYRGKMLRPMLLLVSGMAGAPERPINDAHRTLAAVVEMVHMATLVHDDVLDESEVRRKGTTINLLHGNEAAVMLGDYLISHAYHLCSSIGSIPAARLIAQATNTVCEGELLQLANRNNWSLDEHTYEQIINRKTGVLCGVSCRLGALAGGAPREICDAMQSFGDALGMAFQIIDDVLDLTGDPKVVGKSLGKDLEKGKLTLPLIRRLETAGPADRQQLIDLLRSNDDGRFERIGEMLSASNAVDYAHQRAVRLIAVAKSAVAQLPESLARSTLNAMADGVVTREF
ncbi:MAG: polyprenyl synthetase [Planctomycetaceae bacterium]|nr:polyprenyl synthetase [Planctomycetaceae bacterium]